MIDDKDRGFLLGDGAFETLLVCNGVALWLSEHLQRMKKAARKLDLAFDGEAIGAAAEAAARGEVLGVLRISLSRGVTARGLSADCVTPTLHITNETFDAGHIGKPLRLVTSSVRRNPASVTDRHKTLSYANNVFAAREAKMKSCDDALMLSIDGLVACTTVANLFVIKDKQLITPPEQDGVLAGIMRRFFIEHSGFSVSVRSVEPEELAEADGVFATNSLRLVSPVTAIDGEDLAGDIPREYLQSVLAAAKVQCGFDLMEKVS